jgi:four helix bundle protein
LLKLRPSARDLEIQAIFAAQGVGTTHAPNRGMRTGPLSELTIEAARQTIALVNALPRRRVFYTLGDQLLDSGTSQAANYRAVCRARSTPDFIAKLKIVEEESDESDFWIDRLFDAKLPAQHHEPARHLQHLFVQITRMIVARLKTARERQRALKEAKRRRTRNP